MITGTQFKTHDRIAKRQGASSRQTGAYNLQTHSMLLAFKTLL
jgi:hypothetical protein